MSNIKLLEHNSSRLLFYNTNIEDAKKLIVEDTTTDSHCTEMSNYEYPNNWLLGKLTDKVWFIEDVGIYDSNHEHTGKIYYIDSTTNQENIVYNLTRLMEYSEECDRLYCEHSGSFKIILLDSPEEDLNANFYIKYEKNLPGSYEAIGNLTNSSTGETFYNCIVFYKYDSSDNIIMTEVLQMDFNLRVINDDETLMEGINYCNIIPKHAEIDFSRISIQYQISENNSNDVKLGMISLSPLNENPLDSRHSKFLSGRYYTGNDNVIDPMYFIVQAPKNRSWICYRICYDRTTPGPYSIRKMNNCYCYYIRAGELNGYYGTLNSGKYVYEINIDRSKMPFMFMLPKLFWDYSSIKYYDSSNNVVRVFDGETEDIYNEIDGMYYRKFLWGYSSTTNKIILEYTIS